MYFCDHYPRQRDIHPQSIERHRPTSENSRLDRNVIKPRHYNAFCHKKFEKCSNEQYYLNFDDIREAENIASCSESYPSSKKLIDSSQNTIFHNKFKKDSNTRSGCDVTFTGNDHRYNCLEKQVLSYYAQVNSFLSPSRETYDVTNEGVHFINRRNIKPTTKYRSSDFHDDQFRHDHHR